MSLAEDRPKFWREWNASMASRDPAAPPAACWKCGNLAGEVCGNRDIGSCLFDAPPPASRDTGYVRPVTLEPVLKPSNPKDAVGIRKVPWSCLPLRVIGEVALGLFEGARKYGRHNYRAVGVRGSVYFDATLRHLSAWYEGEDIDKDSGLSHVTKAIASLVVLRDGMMQGNWVDDRPPACDPLWLAAQNAKAADIIERHPNAKAAFTETAKAAFTEEGNG